MAFSKAKQSNRKKKTLPKFNIQIPVFTQHVNTSTLIKQKRPNLFRSIFKRNVLQDSNTKSHEGVFQMSRAPGDNEGSTQFKALLLEEKLQPDIW